MVGTGHIFILNVLLQILGINLLWNAFLNSALVATKGATFESRLDALTH